MPVPRRYGRMVLYVSTEELEMFSGGGGVPVSCLFEMRCRKGRCWSWSKHFVSEIGNGDPMLLHQLVEGQFVSELHGFCMFVPTGRGWKPAICASAVDHDKGGLLGSRRHDGRAAAYYLRKLPGHLLEDFKGRLVLQRSPYLVLFFTFCRRFEPVGGNRHEAGFGLGAVHPSRFATLWYRGRWDLGG